MGCWKLENRFETAWAFAIIFNSSLFCSQVPRIPWRRHSRTVAPGINRRWRRWTSRRCERMTVPFFDASFGTVQCPRERNSSRPWRLASTVSIIVFVRRVRTTFWGYVGDVDLLNCVCMYGCPCLLACNLVATEEFQLLFNSLLYPCTHTQVD